MVAIEVDADPTHRQDVSSHPAPRPARVLEDPCPSVISPGFY